MKIEGNIEFYVVEQAPERVVSEMPILPGIKNGPITNIVAVTSANHRIAPALTTP